MMNEILKFTKLDDRPSRFALYGEYLIVTAPIKNGELIIEAEAYDYDLEEEDQGKWRTVAKYRYANREAVVALMDGWAMKTSSLRLYLYSESLDKEIAEWILPEKHEQRDLRVEMIRGAVATLFTLE